MRIIVFAPHNDDEVLGVGGTMAKLANAGHEVYVCEVTSGKSSELLQSEARKAHKILGVKESFFLNLPTIQLRNLKMSEINGPIQKIVNYIQPEVAFIPHKGDMNMDHGEVAKAAMVVLRPVSCPTIKHIYAYETLSETEWNMPTVDNAFIPNVWSNITNTIETKLEAMRCYQSQIKQFPNPRSERAIRALAEFRGSTACVEQAEAFMSLREIID